MGRELRSLRPVLTALVSTLGSSLGESAEGELLEALGLIAVESVEDLGEVLAVGAEGWLVVSSA